MNLSLVGALLGPFRVSEESSSTKDFVRSPFFVFLSHVEMAFTLASPTNINFFNCTFAVLYQLNSTRMRLRSASTLSSVAKRPLPSSFSTECESVKALMPGAMTPIGKHFFRINIGTRDGYASILYP